MVEQDNFPNNTKKMRSVKFNRTGQLGGLSGNVIAIVLAVIILVLGLVIVQELRDTRITGEAGCNATDTSACDIAYTASNDSLVGLGQFADFIPLIVLAVAAAVVIGVILTAFVMPRGRQR